jgi:VanZ family protein
MVLPTRILRAGLLAALAVYWITMLVLTHLPRAPVVPRVTDKTAHFTGFAVLAALLYLCIWAMGRASGWTAIFVLLVAGVYGMLDELTQPLTGRSCSFLDWMANMSGAAMAVMVVGAVHWVVNRRSELSSQRL